MEKYIQDIEFINKYINGQLTNADKSAFEKRLQTDADFNTLYQEHLCFVEGLNRVVLKQDITAAKQSYIKAKWFKNLGIPILVIGVSVLCYSLFFSETDVVESVKSPVETGVQSVIIVKDTVEVTEVSLEEVLPKTILVEEEPSTEVEKPVQEIQSEEEVILTEIKEVVSTEKEVTKDKPEGLDLEMISFYESQKKTPQVLIINTEKDTTITCKEGTQLKFEAKSFIDTKTNRLARGKINIEVTEFYKLSDMLLANLTTKSDDEQLETGGMLYIEANKKGSRLKLKSGKRVRIAFNNKDNDRMQLFNGEEINGSVNWKLENDTNELEIIEEDIEVPYAVIENAPVYPGCENGDNFQRKQCMSRAIQQFVQRNFNTSIAEDLGITGRQKINVVFKIDKEGFVRSVRSRAPHRLLEQEALRVINLLPPMKPGTQRGKAVIVPYSLPINFQIGRDTNAIFGNTMDTVRGPLIIDSKTVEKLEAKIENENAQDVSGSELNWYVFRSSNLGWINCDRFVRSRKSKIKFKLKIKNYDGADVKLIFKNIKSILPAKKIGDTYDYGSVPQDEDVVVIAIKKLEDSFYLAIKEGKTDLLSDIDLDFNQVSIQEMKTMIESLNLSF